MRTLMLAFLLWFVAATAEAQQIPSAAWSYKAEMSKSAWRTFGPSAPVALLAAQIHQESAWKINATSRVGAQGFSQFMPATAADMAKLHPQDCAPANPFNATWAFTCRDKYMRSLLKSSMNENTSTCSSWAFAMRAYNGGLGWINRDRRKTKADNQNPDNWRIVSYYNAGRSESNFRENSQYPERIFFIERRYTNWGGPLDCI